MTDFRTEREGRLLTIAIMAAMLDAAERGRTYNANIERPEVLAKRARDLFAACANLEP